MIGKIGITKCAHISRRKFDVLFDCFVADITNFSEKGYLEMHSKNERKLTLETV